jgi:hypothetical protein
MARWRTLHEIAVVAMFVSEHGEELAERYVAHEAVENLKAVREYNEFKDRLNLEAFSDEEIACYTEIRNSAVAKYGDAFGADNGWAAKVLKKNTDKLKKNTKGPSFKEIEQATEGKFFRPHYRTASHNVHANPKGIFFKLGLIEESEMILAGPSNFGLADPGQNAALSLLHVSTTLMMLHPTVDSIVALKIMSDLTAEICDGFVESQAAIH